MCSFNEGRRARLYSAAFLMTQCFVAPGGIKQELSTFSHHVTYILSPCSLASGGVCHAKGLLPVVSGLSM